MEPSQVHAELQALSILVDHPEIGANLRVAADVIASQPQVALISDEDQVVDDYLAANLESMPKARSA